MTDDAGEPDAAMYTRMGAFIDELTRAGGLVATGGLDAGTRISTTGGELTVTDGPFTETKEAIVSFALVEVGSREEAIELTRRFHGIVGGGESMMYQVFGPATG
ncbi:hypothetical protein KDL28_39590 [Pseudonocardia sp. S2-4]|uniref:YCII-related domain-containing protein n=2 Tax=Pseudonocardia humida TaxID=2800819 RepID=A0ABT1ADL9_9PSEU|nr:hypothetical protein [Pseudonocardia humida]